MIASDRLLTAKEVARRLGISRRTLWRRVHTREIPSPAMRQRGKPAYWRESDVIAFIAALPLLVNGWTAR